MKESQDVARQVKVGKHRDCTEFPEFKRLKYFYGQLLGAHDFQVEQNYFRNKLKLHQRCLHGYGTVCGLLVSPEPAEVPCESADSDKLEEIRKKYETLLKEKEKEDDPAKAAELDSQIEELRRYLDRFSKSESQKAKPSRVWIDCGLALDCQGNELILRRPLPLDLWQSLKPEEQEEVNKRKDNTLYISLCHCELPVEPMRPVLSDTCGASPECVPGKVVEAVQVRVTTKDPEPDERCETCCDPCGDPCLYLARIDHFQPGRPVEAGQIHNEVRRLLGTYEPTTITGISWTHGAEYDANEVSTMLGTYDPDKRKYSSDGLKVRFSREVLVSTLTNGVVDLWVTKGGKTESGLICSMEGEFVGLSGKTTREFHYRYTGDERLNPGDRLLIIIRTPFILDECCRPVDGAHVGGRVPIILPEFAHFHKSGKGEPPVVDCPAPLPGYRAWTSGTGYYGGNFESWLNIKKVLKVIHEES